MTNRPRCWKQKKKETELDEEQLIVREAVTLKTSENRNPEGPNNERSQTEL